MKKRYRRIDPAKARLAAGGGVGDWRPSFAPCPVCGHEVAAGAECLWCEEEGKGDGQAKEV